MSVNVSGNVISSTGFDTTGNILNSQNIITDGLIMWLDAGNLASYNYVAGTGAGYYDCGYGCQYYASSPGCTNCNTQIKDMSGFGNDGTLTNGASVIFANYGGAMYCTGTNYIVTTAVNEAPTNSNLQTFCGWMIGTGMLFGSNAAGIGQFHLRGRLTSTTLTFDGTYYGAGIAGDGADSVSVSPLAYNHIVFVKTSAKKYDVYFNGDKVMNQINKEATVSTSFYPGLFYRQANPVYNPGTVANYMIYNRALTAAEVLQNFNTDRQRFGV